jgi:hypothetical protein
MKTKLLFIVVCIATILFSANLSAQNTPGTLTFNFTTLNQGTSKCVIAVWIENSAGLFIKTKMRYLGNGCKDHLPNYGVASGGSMSNAMTGNIVDAATGATRSSSTTPVSWGSKSISWNGTNVSGAVVADGVYKVWVEAAWNDGDPDIHDYINTGYSFTKGTAINSSFPTADSVLNAMTLTWTPSTLSLESLYKEKMILYPNPSSGIVNVKYPDIPVTKIDVVNVLGQVVKSIKVDANSAEISKSIDLSGEAKGVYVVNVSTHDTSSSYKIVLDK